MAPIMIAAAMAAVAAWGAGKVDTHLTGDWRSDRLSLSLGLLGASVWLVTLIHAAHWMQSPGAYGPLQNWTDAKGHVSFLFHVRVYSMLVVMGCFLVAVALGVVTVVALGRPHSSAKWRLCVIPIGASAAFAFALHEFLGREFFPKV